MSGKLDKTENRLLRGKISPRNQCETAYFFALEMQRKDDMYYRMSDRGEVISFFIRTMNKESNRTLNDEERGRGG